MNRRQLIASVLGIPFAKPAIVAAMAGPSYGGVALSGITSLTTYELYGDPPYSIPVFINETTWTEQEIALNGKGGGKDGERYKEIRDFKWGAQRATYQFKE